MYCLCYFSNGTLGGALGPWQGLRASPSLSLLTMLLTSIVWPDPLVVPHLKGAEQRGYVDVGELAARDEEDDCHDEWRVSR